MKNVLLTVICIHVCDSNIGLKLKVVVVGLQLISCCWSSLILLLQLIARFRLAKAKESALVW